MKSSFAALGAAAILFSAAGSAQTQTVSAPQQGSTASASQSDPVICQRQEVIGSRLAHKRICMTRSQWQEAQGQDRAALEKVQTQRTMNSGK